MRRHDELRLGAERAAQVLDHELVRRVGDRNDQLASLVVQRERDLKARVLLRKRLERVRLRIRGGDLDVRQAFLARKHSAEILLGDPAALDQHLSEALPGAHSFLECILELLFGEQAGAEDQGSERHVDHRRRRNVGSGGGAAGGTAAGTGSATGSGIAATGSGSAGTGSGTAAMGGGSTAAGGVRGEICGSGSGAGCAWSTKNIPFAGSVDMAAFP